MTKTNKTMLLQSTSDAPLKLCESFDPANNKKKYIFEGIFTACSTDKKTIINRNNRIYRDTEVLRHLPYLRQQIKELGGILGEPAHPDARFDTKIVESSHIIRDLHWVPEDAVVWGRLELLDTPAGEICKTIWDAGYKLSVSSRAAGEVDPQTHEVRIEQIFTYDIVPQGGFSQAILNKVSESLDSNVKKYLNESLGSTVENDDKRTVIAEGLVAKEVNESMPTSPEREMMLKKPLDMEDLCKPLHESECTDECDKTKSAETTEEEFKLPTADLNPATVEEGDGASDDSSEEKKDEEKSSDTEEKTEDKEEKKTLTDEEKAEKRKKILGLEAVDSEGTSNTEADKEEKRAEILDVETKDKEESDDKKDKDDELSDVTEPEEEDVAVNISSDSDNTSSAEEDINLNVANGNSVGSGNASGNDVASGNTTASGNDVASGNTDSGNGNASGNSTSVDQETTAEIPLCAASEPSVPNDIKVKDAEKTAKEVKDKAVNDKEKAEDIKTQTKDDMDKFSALLKKAKKLADVKESIVNLYPFAISMSDDNFAQFAALKSGDKNKVQKYIMEHNIFSIADINELWKTPLLEEKRQLKNWLRLASEEDKRLFAAAPMDVQDAIEESAKYVMIQTKQDADNFWNKTGLRQAAAHKIINESMRNRYDVVDSEDAKNATVLNENAANLGYSMNYFKMLEDMY